MNRQDLKTMWEFENLKMKVIDRIVYTEVREDQDDGFQKTYKVCEKNFEQRARVKNLIGFIGSSPSYYSLLHCIVART